MSTTPHYVTEVVDPVCGMTITPEDAVGYVEYRGQTYYSCAKSGLEQFRANPERFTSREKVRLKPDPTSEVEYTCPMHPEIRQRGPGSCPICGMALEPVTVTAHEEANPELEDMTRRFGVSAVLTVPAVLLAMSDLLPGSLFASIAHAPSLGWIQLALATPVVLWGGWPFFVRGWQSVVNRSPNMFTLIALGVGVAYVYSVIAVI